MTISQLQLLNKLIILATESIEEVNDQVDLILTRNDKSVVTDDFILASDALDINLSGLVKKAADLDELLIDLKTKKKGLLKPQLPLSSVV